jgi:hypothetical protein
MLTMQKKRMWFEPYPTLSKRDGTRAEAVSVGPDPGNVVPFQKTGIKKPRCYAGSIFYSALIWIASAGLGRLNSTRRARPARPKV